MPPGPPQFERTLSSSSSSRGATTDAGGRRMFIKSLFRTPIEELEKQGDDEVSLGIVENSNAKGSSAAGNGNDSAGNFEGSLGNLSAQSGGSKSKKRKNGRLKSQSNHSQQSNHSNQSQNSATSMSFSGEDSDAVISTSPSKSKRAPFSPTNTVPPLLEERPAGRAPRRSSMGALGTFSTTEMERLRSDMSPGGLMSATSHHQRQSRRTTLSLVASPHANSVRTARSIPGLTYEDILASQPGSMSMRTGRTTGVKLRDDDSSSFKTDRSGTTSSSDRSSSKKNPKKSSKKSNLDPHQEEPSKDKKSKKKSKKEKGDDDAAGEKKGKKDKSDDDGGEKKSKKDKGDDQDADRKSGRSSSVSRPKNRSESVSKKPNRSSSVGTRRRGRDDKRGRSASPQRRGTSKERNGRSMRPQRTIDAGGGGDDHAFENDARKGYDYNNKKQMKKDLKEALKKVRDLMEERRAYSDEAIQAKAELLQARIELQEAQEVHNDLRGEIREVHNMIHEKDDKINSLEMAIDSQLDQMDELARELKTATEETYAMEDRVIELEAQMASGGGPESREKENEALARLEERLRREKAEILIKLSEKDDVIEELRAKLKENQSTTQTSAGETPLSDDVTALQRSNRKMQADMKADAAKNAGLIKKKDETITYLQMELFRMKADLDDREFGNYIQLKKEVESSKTEVQVAKSKFEGAQRRCMMLEEDIDHWKRVSCDLEDEVAEWKSEAAQWKARYEELTQPHPGVPPPTSSSEAATGFFGGTRKMMRRGSTGAVPRYSSDDASAFSSQASEDSGEENRPRNNLWSKLRKPAET